MRLDHTRRPVWTSCAVAIGALALAALLWQTVHSPPAAFAQIQDPGAQRAAHLTELRRINKQLGEIVKILGEIRDQNKAVEAKPQPKPPPFRPPE